MKIRLLMPLLFLPLLLAACSSPPDPEVTSATPPPPTTEPNVDALETSEMATLDTDQLPRYHWHLDDAVDGDGQPIDALLAKPDNPLQLDFIDDRIAISNTCNRIGGNYTLAGNALHVSHMMQTQMACDDEELMLLDSTVGERMPGDATVRLDAAADPPQLTLAYADGDVFSFTGVPTAATRYGDEGETLFFEVAAQTVPCDADSDDGEQCLHVREREYDDNGVIIDTDRAWHVLAAPIDGYQHEPGVSNVLRLKHYTPQGQDEALVLDMVVESESER